ncbi:MAG: LytTR family DNA-binding domain-containing protein [Bacteroidota bacterium]
MTTYKTLIVDDEKPARELLKLHVGKVSELELIGTCSNAIEAKRILSENTVDILLLDVQMDEITGLDLLRMLKVQPATILTTAYSEFALEGYELDVIDYLVKPISFQRFFKSVSKAIEFVKAKKVLSNPNLPTTPTAANHLFIKIENKLVKIELDNLLYLESFGEYVKFHTSDKMHMTLKTLTSFEKSLPSNSFYRLHRSYMVNLNKIDVIEDGSVKIGEKWIPISRKLKEEFLQILKRRGVYK